MIWVEWLEALRSIVWGLWRNGIPRKSYCWRRLRATSCKLASSSDFDVRLCWMFTHSNSHVAHEILTALAYLHSRPLPIVHRDVKSSNIQVKMDCDCYNPLVCVCRRRPGIILSDFDASLELGKDGMIQPDPPRPVLLGSRISSTVSSFECVICRLLENQIMKS